MANEVYTETVRRQIAVGSRDVWTVDFDAPVVDGDPITSGSAVLERVNAAASGTVSGFVTDVDVDDETVLVEWDGAVLQRGAFYELRTTAELTSGAILIVVTPIEAV